jgi:glycosyltransferase involved in cell wall biosynthesis
MTLEFSNKKKIRLGIGVSENDTWGFFNEIYRNLNQYYQTTIFKPRTTKITIRNNRINRYLFTHDLQSFLDSNDVVFFEWASDLLAFASTLPKKCKIITRLHRYEMYHWAEKIHWDNVDRIILVSHAKEREFISKFPSQVSKTIVLSPSTSLEKFHPNPRTFNGNIGILCHIAPRKRVYDLILAYSELIKKKNDFHLHIAGGYELANEDYYHAIQRLVGELELEDKITFYGKIQDPWNWFPMIDIFVSNSYSEGLQVALMEAMASGCYCLSHNWDGADELLPMRNLYFTNTELQEKIIAYYDMKLYEKQNQMNLMREIASEKCDINQTIAQIRQVIEELAKI